MDAVFENLLAELACENIHFSSLFAAGDVSSPAAKSEEKRMFSQAIAEQVSTQHKLASHDTGPLT